ncbi:Fic family protein [Pelagibacterium halotolerans]|uniref:Fic family protein n=1 Tax=Pelagibacterium halotolerans TaxID=531813 RepID=UPI00384C2741
MRTTDFSEAAPGKLVPTIEGAQAFVPLPLPPEIELEKIAIAMANAMQAIGELKGACRRLANPYILVRPLQRQEALTSSAMEGTFTTDDHLLLAEAGVDRQKDESTTEVYNYLEALNECLELLPHLPISHRMLRRAHEILLSGLSSSRGAQKRPGEYKREQNWIGGRTIDMARYVPPPPKETQRCMDELESYINRSDTAFPTPLIDLALVHYQLEAIHPFADGNGRVGRMLISLMAVHSGLLEMPVLYISPVMERWKDEYIDLMFHVSAKGDWASWLNFFFDRVAESCSETVSTVDRLLALQDEYRSIAGKLGRTSNAITLIDYLFERPAITVNDAVEKLGVTYPAAKNTIDKLAEAGILAPLEGSYPKVYFAPTIMRVSRPIESSSDGSASGETEPELPFE